MPLLEVGANDTSMIVSSECLNGLFAAFSFVGANELS